MKYTYKGCFGTIPAYNQHGAMFTTYEAAKISGNAFLKDI